MVIDGQNHWRHSIHLLHEIWEKMDLDKEIQFILVLQFFQLIVALKTSDTVVALKTKFCCIAIPYGLGAPRLAVAGFEFPVFLLSTDGVVFL